MLTGGPLRAAPHLLLPLGAMLRGCPSLPPRPPGTRLAWSPDWGGYMEMAPMGGWMLENCPHYFAALAKPTSFLISLSFQRTPPPKK